MRCPWFLLFCLLVISVALAGILEVPEHASVRYSSHSGRVGEGSLLSVVAGPISCPVY